MATFSQPTNKRQKLAKDASRTPETSEYFPGINKIEYKGTSAPYDDTLCYHYYNAYERINGRTMEDWIKPALSLSAFRNNGSDVYGKSTFHRSWDDNSNTVENCKRVINACFEFCSKLGIKHWTGFDSDFIPDVEFFDDHNMVYDDMYEFVHDAQQKYSVKPLWIAPDLHSDPRFASGASTSNNATIMTQAGHKMKKCLELCQKLDAESFLICGLREGYYTILNTDLQKELKHFARLLKMSSDYKDQLGFKGHLLLNPTNLNDSITRYLCDSASSICFLKHYNLERQFKLVSNFGHQLYMSTIYNLTGSVELQNDKLNVKDSVFMMKTITENGGFQPGGVNLKFIPKRDSVDHKDLFATYIQHIDILAKGLKINAKIQDHPFSKNIQQRYSSYYSGFGSRLSNGEATLEECESQIRKLHNQFSEFSSNRCEHWEAAFENLVNTIKLN